MPEWAEKEVILPMKQDNLHLCTQDGIEQTKTVPSKQVLPVAITSFQDEKSFTERDKATLRKLLLDLIFSEPRGKNGSHP